MLPAMDLSLEVKRKGKLRGFVGAKLQINNVIFNYFELRQTQGLFSMAINVSDHETYSNPHSRFYEARINALRLK